MERLIFLAAALGIAAAVFAALYFIQKKRMERLTARIEEFLVTGKNELEYSVREDSVAPIHNAAAELENRILLSKEQVKDELKRTSALIADISHQLKTPLASLKLFCELDEGAHMEAQLGQIERMERLIYSLLRLERLCADGYDFTFEAHNVERIVAEAWESLKPVYPGRTLDIEGSARIRCDEKWLGEAFLNLLKNACEHTGESGKLRVRLEMTESTFFAVVEDNGGGVSQKDLPHLFERFYRAGDQKEKGGAGIGLSIVREIVRRHHGDIRAENTGKGLKFTITMPIMNLIRT